MVAKQQSIGKSEKEVEDDIKKIIRPLPVRLCRFPAGRYRSLDGLRIVEVGQEGDLDFFGYKMVIITQEMVGKKVAIHLEIEAKKEIGGIVSEEQWKSVRRIRAAGGIAGVAASAEDAVEIINKGVNRWDCNMTP